MNIAPTAFTKRRRFIWKGYTRPKRDNGDVGSRIETLGSIR
ncbi:MAG: hypothetical protein R3C26_18810 [Calditrichia bacterium]